MIMACAVQAGVSVAFASDWPVVELEPLATLHTAVNNNNLTLPDGRSWGPNASVDPETALRAHTLTGAVACNMQNEVGMLRCASPLSPPLPSPRKDSTMFSGRDAVGLSRASHNPRPPA